MGKATVRILLFVAIFAACTSISAFAARLEAPPSSNLKWKSDTGDDYTIYSGTIEGLQGKIGVYRGCCPRCCNPNTRVFFLDGKIENTPIKWYKINLSHYPSRYPFAIETQYDDKKTDIAYHIWVKANDEKTLEKLRMLAEEIRYK